MTKPVIVQFTTPIPYGDAELAELTLRPPKAGDLRGLKLMTLTDADPAFILRLTSRIAMTPVAEEQLYELSAFDTMKLAEAVVGFFSPPETPAVSPTTPTGHGPS